MIKNIDRDIGPNCPRRTCVASMPQQTDSTIRLATGKILCCCNANQRIGRRKGDAKVALRGAANKPMRGSHDAPAVGEDRYDPDATRVGARRGETSEIKKDDPQVAKEKGAQDESRTMSICVSTVDDRGTRKNAALRSINKVMGRKITPYDFSSRSHSMPSSTCATVSEAGVSSPVGPGGPMTSARPSNGWDGKRGVKNAGDSGS